ncbi:MAG: YggT family protein [Gammaproteobacteria bacterium]|nr:YggT family protein [Gammaproteobacteria bacterium]
MGYATNAGTFLVETLIGLVLMVVMLRFLLQLIRADFNNPVSQFIVKVTNPMLVPLRRFIPGVAGIDMSSVVLLFGIQYLELFLLTIMNGAQFFAIGMIVIAIAKIIGLAITVFTFSILIQVVISWVNPGVYNPVVGLLYQINEPVLGRARKLIPPIQGFDLSPIVAMIALQLISMLVVAPISDFGVSLR